MVHDVTKPLPGEVPRIYGTTVLPNGTFVCSHNSFESVEEARQWMSRMKQIYPGGPETINWMARNVKPDTRFKEHWDQDYSAIAIDYGKRGF